MNGSLVTVSSDVFGRCSSGAGVPRWVVVATFIGIDGSEPRCVDYRVRVVPEPPPGSKVRPEQWFLAAARRVADEMKEGTIAPGDAAVLGGVPPEGIPRRVFETASQAKLLARARRSVERRPEKHGEMVRELLQRPTAKVGRPPARSLGEKVRILADVEQAFAGADRTLADVAADHNMSRSSLRDLLGWARHDANPRLFVSYGPGRRGGHLTPAARALLTEIDQED